MKKSIYNLLPLLKKELKVRLCTCIEKSCKDIQQSKNSIT